MRADAATVLLVASAVSAIGCIGRDRDPLDPSDFNGSSAEERVPSRAPRGDPQKTVHAACDEDGNLHVRAPENVRVTTPEDARANAEAEIALDDQPGRPIRRTKSLGFIGDNKLGPSRSHGGPWNAPDGVLPPHRHGYPSYGGPGSYVYRPSWGYGPPRPRLPYDPAPWRGNDGRALYASPAPIPPAYWR
jgi:hypothetical protein